MMFGKKMSFVVVMLFFASYTTTYSQTKSTGTTTSTAQYKGLQTSRTDLVTGLSTIDSLLHFKEVANVKGAPKQTAKGSYGARIEITGTEDNITKAQWTVGQPASGTLNKLAFTRMAFFVNILARQEGAMWFFEQINNYNKAPTEALNNINFVNGTKLMFDYSPVKKVFTVTISPQ